jgi:hypothetical protein
MPSQKENSTPSIWLSKSPQIRPPFLGSMCRRLASQQTTTNLSWPSLRTISIFSTYQASPQGVLRFSSFIVRSLLIAFSLPHCCSRLYIWTWAVSFFQPEAQSYGNFPATHGQATSFFQDVGVGPFPNPLSCPTHNFTQVQEEFAFIPDDGSATYIINVEVLSFSFPPLSNSLHH